MYFSMGDYKTNNYAENGKMRNRGIDIISIPVRLKQVLRMWRKYSPDQKPLIVNNRKGRMSANS